MKYQEGMSALAEAQREEGEGAMSSLLSEKLVQVLRW